MRLHRVHVDELAVVCSQEREAACEAGLQGRAGGSEPGLGAALEREGEGTHEDERLAKVAKLWQAEGRACCAGVGRRWWWGVIVEEGRGAVRVGVCALAP